MKANPMLNIEKFNKILPKIKINICLYRWRKGLFETRYKNEKWKITREIVPHMPQKFQPKIYTFQVVFFKSYSILPLSLG